MAEKRELVGKARDLLLQAATNVHVAQIILDRQEERKGEADAAGQLNGRLEDLANRLHAIFIEESS